jgi:hypothetical protein
MHPQRLRLVLINVLGGLAVLGSYAWGLGTHADAGAQVWGGVPEGLKPLYTVSMLLAAAGYFPFTAFILFGLDPERVRVAGRFGYAIFPLLYALILAPSALWMPLTFAMVETPSAGLWLSIRLVLFAVAAGSLGILAALRRSEPRPRGVFYGLAIAGCIAFCVQTALLDAFVWPAYF